MARNADITLTLDEARRVSFFEGIEEKHLTPGQGITVEFTKRDGTARTITGEYVEVMGARSDKRVFVVETDNGPRSANLWLTHTVSTDGGTWSY